MRGLRFATLTVVAFLASVATESGARPPPRRAAPVHDVEAAREGQTSAAVVTLRAPASAEVLIRAGTFTMGSSEAEITNAVALCQLERLGTECKDTLFADEYAPHDVYLDAYWMDRTEVTVAAYGTCVAAGVCAEPSFAGAERFNQPDLPVVLVSWFDAQKYCGFRGARLPTEAEWERAARGLTGRRYSWGNVWDPFVLNHGRSGWSDLDDADGFLELAPVGSFPDGRTPDGIDDLAGNVDEWVADYYAQEYPKVDVQNPKGPDVGDFRVVRGGAYGGFGRPPFLPEQTAVPTGARPWLRAAARAYDLPSRRLTTRGFRCVHNDLR
jgi:formylglycine-generating enzyme required for sulfatase activity